jgi:hypothetical protein
LGLLETDEFGNRRTGVHVTMTLERDLFVCVMLEDQSMQASGFTLMPYSDKAPEFVPTAAVEEHARGGKVHGRSETFE